MISCSLSRSTIPDTATAWCAPTGGAISHSSCPKALSVSPYASFPTMVWCSCLTMSALSTLMPQSVLSWPVTMSIVTVSSSTTSLSPPPDSPIWEQTSRSTIPTMWRPSTTVASQRLLISHWANQALAWLPEITLQSQ